LEVDRKHACSPETLWSGAGGVPAVLFHPASAESVRCADRLVSLYLLAAQCGEGCVMASESLDDEHCMIGGDPRDVQAFAGSSAVAVLADALNAQHKVRFLRLPTREKQEATRCIERARCATAPGVSPTSAAALAAEWPPLARTAGKPLILILPAMMAVGGVERNTIEIIRSLSHKFDFLIISTERIGAKQGSLAQQARDASARVIELGEIEQPSMHLAMLAEAKRAARPDVVWICNGSPWISRHSGDLRALFADTPILDQRAYDDQLGWISDYADPNCRAFEGYVAVNTRIERRMIEEFGLPPSRVRRIYSAVNGSAIRSGIAAWGQQGARAVLGLPEQGLVLSFVGRLTPQKQPLRFLQLAAKRKAFSDELFVVVGDGDLGTPLPMSEALQAGIKGSELCVIKDAAHLSTFEQPEAFNSLLRGFLD
jgi:hypothetical protein